MPIAATRSVTESGNRRAPVARAERPRQTERYSGTTKKRPAWTRYWKKNISRPPLSWRFFSSPGRTSGSSPRASRRASHREKSQMTNNPARTSHTVGESPAQDGAPDFGWIQPHSPERRIPKTSRPSPSADSTAPTMSKRGRLSRGASAILRVKRRMTITSTTSPAKTQRHEKYVVQNPPISGPTATATAPAAATRPYAAGRRATGKFPATSATIEGRIRTAPRPSRNDQPNKRTGRLGARDVVSDPHP